ncbi:MAG: hypothetical protein ACFCU2_13325, partial [Acidimicrobiia bacterium]
GSADLDDDLTHSESRFRVDRRSAMDRASFTWRNGEEVEPSQRTGMARRSADYGLISICGVGAIAVVMIPGGS